MNADAIDGFIGIVVVLLVVGTPVLLLIAAYEWIVKNRNWFEPPKPSSPPRPNLRIPERERALLGDDYRDVVAPYFAISRRRQEIVRQLTQEQTNDAE